MVLQAVVAILIFLLPPQLAVRWSGGSYQGIKAVMDGYDPALEQCARSGLEVHYRYELKLCRRRSMWLDACAVPRVEQRSVQYDPISESYTVNSDRLDDEEPPRAVKTASFAEAMQQVVLVPYMSLAFLDRDRIGVERYPDSYVSARVVSECRGSYTQALSRLSYFLSLGLLRTSGSDTGWVDFQLSRD